MTAHENLIAVPPDGGWGWIIVAICFYGNIVIDVPTMGFQVVLPFLTELLGMSATRISFIFSAYSACMMALGPFAAAVCNRYGFQATSLVGCALTIGGLVGAYFSEEFLSFLLLYGVLAGCGSAFIVMVCAVAPGFWFESRRAIASGMAMSAGGISVITVTGSFFVQATWGWRACFLLWSAMTVIMAFLSFMLTPPPMVELEALGPLGTAGGELTMVDVRRITTVTPLGSGKRGRKTEEKIKWMTMQNGLQLTGPRTRPSMIPQSMEPTGCWKYCACFRCGWCPRQIGARPLYRKDIFYAGNLDHIVDVEHKERETFTLTATTLPTTQDIEEELVCHWKIPQAMTRAVASMMDFSLFKSPVFNMLVIASFLINTVRYIPFLFIKRINIDYMDGETASGLRLLMGLGVFILRTFIGVFLFAFRNISGLAASTTLTIAAGVTICSLTLVHWLPYQILLSFFSGAFSAVNAPLRSVIIIDKLGLDKLTSATGILFFVQAFAALIGVPLCEIIVEYMGTDDAGMIFSGLAYVIAGLFYIAITFFPGKKRPS